jgi:hypothetical protein
MGLYGTYCGTVECLYEAQINHNQLKGFTESGFLNYIEDTLIPAAEGFINTFIRHSCGTPTPGTIRLDGNGKKWLPLPLHFHPAIGFSSVTADGVDITTDIVVYDRYIKRTTKSTFPSGHQNIVCVGSYGYLDAGGNPIIPGDISMVAIRLVGNVIADMNRKHMMPDIFMNLFGDRKQAQGSTFHALYASPKIFSPYLKETLIPYRVKWVDVG